MIFKIKAIYAYKKKQYYTIFKFHLYFNFNLLIIINNTILKEFIQILKFKIKLYLWIFLF